MDDKPMPGLYVVLKWTKKPKKLGTGFYWKQVSEIVDWRQANETMKKLAKLAEQYGKTVQYRLWPVFSGGTVTRRYVRH